MEPNPEKPVLTGKEGGPIDLDTAAAWTKNHREKHPGEVISHFFGKEILEKILAQEGCVGLRFYHAYDEKGKKHLVISGAGSDGQDQLNTHTLPLHMLGDQSLPCPGQPGCTQGVLAGK